VTGTNTFFWGTLEAGVMSVDARRLRVTLLIVGRALKLRWGDKHVMAEARVHGIFLGILLLRIVETDP